MKQKLYIILPSLLLAIFSCSREVPVQEENVSTPITFRIENGLSDIPTDQPDCSLEADYVMVLLKNESGQSTTHYLSIENMPEGLETEPLVLDEGQYTIQEFILFDDAGTEGHRTDDQMVSAGAHSESEYGKMANTPLEYKFSTAELFVGGQAIVNMEVFCYDPLKDWFYWYGFVWFSPQMTVLKQALFFGDFCSYEFEAYAGSLYGDFPKVDMPAIFRIDLYKDEDGNGTYEKFLGTFNNEQYYTSNGQEAYVPPLGIYYTDNDDLKEHYKLNVSVYDLTGVNELTGTRTFGYKYFETWYFTDDAEIMYKDVSYRSNVSGLESVGPGKDGVYDFIVGPCTVIEWDFDLDDPDYGDGQETQSAYAFYAENSDCFINIGFSRWGWTNLLRNKKGTEYSLPLYADADGCDAETAIHVGIVSVKVLNDGRIKVNYEMFEGYVLEETHLYAGKSILPRVGGNYTISSEQFPFRHDDLGGASSDSYTITFNSNANFYLVAHAIIKGF